MYETDSVLYVCFTDGGPGASIAIAPGPSSCARGVTLDVRSRVYTMEYSLSILTQLMTQLYQHLFAGGLSHQLGEGLLALLDSKVLDKELLETPHSGLGDIEITLDQFTSDLGFRSLRCVNVLHRLQDLELEPKEVGLFLGRLARIGRAVDQTVIGAYRVCRWGLNLGCGLAKDFLKRCHANLHSQDGGLRTRGRVAADRSLFSGGFQITDDLVDRFDHILKLVIRVACGLDGCIHLLALLAFLLALGHVVFGLLFSIHDLLDVALEF